MRHFCARAVGVHHLVQALPRSTALRSAAAGFTLIELMVTVAIVAILLAVGVPSMQNFLTSRAVVSQSEELSAVLRLARSDALRLNSRVTVCASANTGDAAPTCSSGDAVNWNAGWLTFIDIDGNGSRNATTERLLRVREPLKSVGAITSDDGSYVQFFPNGLPATGSATFELKPSLASTAPGYNAMVRRVELNSAGRTIILVGTAEQ